MDPAEEEVLMKYVTLISPSLYRAFAKRNTSEEFRTVFPLLKSKHGWDNESLERLLHALQKIKWLSELCLGSGI